MTYHQITQEERYIISALRKQGLNNAQIGNATGRHRSTIGREFRRNVSRFDVYRLRCAQEKTTGRRSRSRRNRQFTAHDFKRVDALIIQQYSPEQVSGALRRTDILSISHETIYQHIWNDKREGGALYTHLRCARKQRRKRHQSYDSRGKLAGKRPISERPASADNRSRLGHWEIDTVMVTSDKDCVVTIVERKTGYLLIGKLPDRTKESLTQRTTSLIHKHRDNFTSITADNGTEFHGYKDIEKAADIRFYFATPHHSWERGSNENTNGLIRQYLPKGKSMAGVTQHDCNAIARKLNTRPRKRYGFRTPEECYYDL